MQEELLNGIIYKGIGGFYYIKTEDGIIKTRARGKFRKDNIVPMIGDRVSVKLTEDEKNTGNDYLGSIVKIYDRKNSFIRPPVANIDRIIITFSVKDPEPDLFLIDKMIVLAEYQDVTPVLCINKIDLDYELAQKYGEIYKLCGYDVILSSSTENIGLGELENVLKDKTSAFAGNSGVGKSSILNILLPSELLKTGEVSDKIQRGRHTTRHTELFALPFGGFVFDTPGFGALMIEQLRADELQNLFADFKGKTNSCRFSGCRHINEPDCRIKEAVKNGEISQSRYDSYVKMYENLKDIKEWMR